MSAKLGFNNFKITDFPIYGDKIMKFTLWVYGTNAC